MKRIPYLHIALFLLTFLTTLAAGAIQLGIDIIEAPSRIVDGWPFAVTLMSILLCHEFSHYLASKKHHTRATLPYFIPAPSIIGTFGAFIKMQSPIATRRALIDIGASGPIAGFLISVAACIIGLRLSQVIPLSVAREGLGLGDSLLFSGLAWLVVGTLPAQADILLHPVAFAGWIGLFITSLNLIPIGQLDGGHIAFAFLGNRHRAVSLALVLFLAFFGILFWEGWTIWALLMMVLGIGHPPVIFWEQPIDTRRQFIGATSLVIFLITFTPSPFTLPD